jgi:hypothetical protein
MRVTTAIAVVSVLRELCGSCPNIDETVVVLPPANGDATIAVDLPEAGAALSADDCRRLCDAATVVTCSFSEPGGVPTLHCVVPPICP